MASSHSYRYRPSRAKTVGMEKRKRGVGEEKGIWKGKVTSSVVVLVIESSFVG